MVGELDPELPNATFVELTHTMPPPVAEFVSVTEARNVLVRIAYAWTRQTFGSEVNPAPFLHRLVQWHGAFADFVTKNNSALSPRDLCLVALLGVHYRQTELSIRMVADASTGSLDGEWWDEQTSSLKEIVDLSKTLVDTEADLNSSLPFFALDAGINVALLTTAVQCRDPVIRRDAITVLRSADRQEGFWNGKVAAQFAQQVVLFEECGLDVRSCGDVPGGRRLRDISVRFESESVVADMRCGDQHEKSYSVVLWKHKAE